MVEDLVQQRNNLDQGSEASLRSCRLSDFRHKRTEVGSITGIANSHFLAARPIILPYIQWQPFP